MMRRQGHRRLACLALALLVACGGATAPVITPDAVLGTWTLQSVNAVALPYNLSQSGADYVRLTTGEIEFSDIGRFQQLSRFDTFQGGQANILSIVNNGGWTLNRGRVVMSFANRSTISATISGTVMTYKVDDNTYTYSKTDDP